MTLEIAVLRTLFHLSRHARRRQRGAVPIREIVARTGSDTFAVRLALRRLASLDLVQRTRGERCPRLSLSGLAVAAAVTTDTAHGGHAADERGGAGPNTTPVRSWSLPTAPLTSTSRAKTTPLRPARSVRSSGRRRHAA